MHVKYVRSLKNTASASGYCFTMSDFGQREPPRQNGNSRPPAWGNSANNTLPPPNHSREWDPPSQEEYLRPQNLEPNNLPPLSRPNHSREYVPPIQEVYLRPQNLENNNLPPPSHPGLFSSRLQAPRHGWLYPPPGFTFRSVQIPFLPQRNLFPPINRLPIENGRVPHSHTVGSFSEVTLSEEFMQVTISDNSPMHPSVSAQELPATSPLSIFQRNNRISNRQSRADGELLPTNHTIPSIPEVSARGILRSYRTPRRPRAPLARRFCCNRHRGRASQLPNEAYFRPLRSNTVADFSQLRNILMSSVNRTRPRVAPPRVELHTPTPIRFFYSRTRQALPRRRRQRHPIPTPRTSESSGSSDGNEDVDTMDKNE